MLSDCVILCMLQHFLWGGAFFPDTVYIESFVVTNVQIQQLMAVLDVLSNMMKTFASSVNGW